MATATLTFDLNNPDDVMAHMRCVRSVDMALVLFGLREVQKSIEREIDHNEKYDQHTLDHVMERIYDLIEYQGLVIEDLIN